MGKKRQSGAVSLFAVIFATLLLSILTIGFIKLMLNEQQQATKNDLSQSALDAALAGVEDAKRVVRAALNGNAQAEAALNASRDCKVVARARVNGDITATETIIRSSNTSGQEFNQAYTCVDIIMDTPDYLYEALENKTHLIPLKSKSDIGQVVVEWYTAQDAGIGVTPTVVLGDSLPPKADWGIATPPVMRVQLITPGAHFSLDDLNKSNASQTAFLRPSVMTSGPSNTTVAMSPGVRSRATDNEAHNNAPVSIGCSRDFSNNQYACRATLDLGRAVTPAENKNAFIRLNTLYKGANVRVSLKTADGRDIKFDGAQPLVDSTGRASDLFRRVEARLRIGEDFPYPTAINIINNLCKDFSVLDNEVVAGSCRP